MNPQDPNNQPNPPQPENAGQPAVPPAPQPAVQPQVFAPTQPPSENQPVSAPPPGVITPTVASSQGSSPAAPSSPQPPIQQPAPGQPFPPATSSSGPVPPMSPGISADSQNPFSTKLPKSKSKLIKIIIAAVLVIATAAAVFFLVLPKLGGIPLEKYEGENFSVLAPKDYESKEDQGGQIFEEKDSDENTRSQVIASAEKSPEKITKEQQDQLLSLFESGFDQGLEQEIGKDNELEDYKSEKTTHKGNSALMITANIKKDGKEVGKVKIIMGISESAYYLIGVMAHYQDKGLVKSTDKIIDSFELK